ncbi:MAG: GPW/gp25 family protein [Patescibacteria group bacterium]
MSLLPNENDPVGNGWKQPFQIYRGGVAFSGAPKGSDMNDVYRKNVVRQSIKEIVLTALKEWTMRRRFGSKLMDLPFATLIEASAWAERYVVEAINQQEKRIMNARCTIQVDSDKGCLEIGCSYTIIRIGSADSMTFPFYLEDMGV